MGFQFLSSARTAVVGSMLTYRALFPWLTPLKFVGTLLAGPVFQLLFFVYLGKAAGVANDEFYELGNVMLSLAVPCITGTATAMARERAYGTLSHIMIVPFRHSLIWLSRGLPCIATGLVVGSFTLIFAVVVVGGTISASALPGIGLAIAVGCLSCTACGVLIGALALCVRSIFAVASLAYTTLILLTGAVVPRQTLPTWIQWAGNFVPLTHSIESVRLYDRQGSFSTGLADIGLEIVVGAGYLVLAVTLLRYLERLSREKGTLEFL